jgi:DNA-directed RNA polymerase subunit RPC12/RpoP
VIPVQCSTCQAKFNAPDDGAGKRAKCPNCSSLIVIPGPSAVPQPPPLPSPAAYAIKASAMPPPTPPPLPTSAVPPRTPRRTPPPLPHVTVSDSPGGVTVVMQMQVPPAIREGMTNSVGFAMSGLVHALSARKIGYFILGTIVFTLLWIIPSGLLMVLASVTKSDTMMRICLSLTVVLYVGLLGVVAGGMAYLTDRDVQGRGATISSAFGFCARRSTSLFVGTVLLVVVIVVVGGVVNGTILRLNLKDGTAGPFLTAVLFLPQLLVDLGLTIALVVWVLIPIAIASENIPALQAIGRVQTCLCRDTGRFFAHCAVTMVIGVTVLGVLVLLSYPALLMVFLTNEPISSTGKLAFGQLISKGRDISGADILRALSVGLALLAVIGYFVAYWVGSFTGYYKDAVRRGFRG